MEEIQKSTKRIKNFKSVILLVVVIGLTVGLNFYNKFIEKEIYKLKSEISLVESSISEVKKDKKVQIYSLLNLNNSVINSFKQNNKINRYINHMNVIQSKYNLSFKGFNLNNGNISSSVEIVSDDKAIAYQKTRDFLKNYRKDKKALFDLDFVNNIRGMDDMKFKINFKIKN